MTFELPEILSPMECLWVTYRATKEMDSCPYSRGTGTCVTGCQTEPSCWTDCPDAEGWGPEVHRLELLIARELEAAEPDHLAGGCYVRVRPGWNGHPNHPNAPQGLSFCHGCRRVVIRGKGRWWR